MRKEDLYKLEYELRQNGYTRYPDVKETHNKSTSYQWIKCFVKKDFNTDKDYGAYIIEYNVTTNKYAGNGVDLPELEVIVKIHNNFGSDIKIDTEISKPYVSTEYAQLVAEQLWKCGNKHIITKKFLKYHWNMFKNWFILHIDTIIVAIACGVFCAVAITQQN